MHSSTFLWLCFQSRVPTFSSSFFQWTDDTVRPSLLPQSYGACTTERTLKEKLYYEILALFDKGQLWERAIQICQELQKDYEENTFDYLKLGGLLVSVVSSWYLAS